MVLALFEPVIICSAVVCVEIAGLKEKNTKRIDDSSPCQTRSAPNIRGIFTKV